MLSGNASMIKVLRTPLLSKSSRTHGPHRGLRNFSTIHSHTSRGSTPHLIRSSPPENLLRISPEVPVSHTIPPPLTSASPTSSPFPELPSATDAFNRSSLFGLLSPNMIQQFSKLASSIDQKLQQRYSTKYHAKNQPQSAPFTSSSIHTIPSAPFSTKARPSSEPNPKKLPPRPSRFAWLAEMRARVMASIERAASAPSGSGPLAGWPKFHSAVRLMLRATRAFKRWLKRAFPLPEEGASVSSHGGDGSLTLSSVTAAVTGNTVVCLCKFVAAAYSSSGVLFAEALHSLADVFNQALLMVGIQQSSRAPSTLHPYGYGPARFAYALISATGVFFLGCGVSLYHAVGNLLDPSSHLVEFSPLILNVMLFSLIVESITCVYAVMVVRRLCAASGMRFWQYLREGTDTTAIAVVVEDLVAVAGILTASAALYATYTTGNAIWDTVGTLAVGLGMGAVAVFLISRNLNVIMGKSFSVSQQRAIMNVLRSRPSVLSIHDMKTVTYGENDHRFKAEVQFHGRQLAKQVLYGPAPEVGEFWRSQTDSLKRGHMLPHTDGALAGRALLHMLQNPSAEGMTKHSAEDLLLRYGDEIVSEVGREVDSVERLMKINFPFITHVDLESHVPVFASQEQDQYLSSKTKALDAVSSTADDSFTSSFTFEAYANAEPLPIFAMDSLYSEQAQSVNSFDKPVIGKFPVATADETNATTSSSINNSEQNKKSL